MPSSDDKFSPSFLFGLILLLWFIFDTSGHGLIYPSIIDFSWFEMAMLDCSELGDIEELLPGLVSECEAERTRAQYVCMLAVVVGFPLLVYGTTKPILSELEKEMIELDDRLLSLEIETDRKRVADDTANQIDEWLEEDIEEKIG